MLRSTTGTLAVFCLWLLVGIGSADICLSADTLDLRKSILYNETAYIPPQCYTKTEDAAKRVHNPCYTCHTRSHQPNYINDDDLQLAYALPEPGLANPWRNLFEDRRQRIAAISHQEILDYIQADNYKNDAGEIAIAKKLGELPPTWDYNGNGRWDGYTPDCYFNFDPEGFDRHPNGQATGWRAFAYYPFPGTHWPTNGSTTDIAIRLSDSFRNNRAGEFDRDVYRINLAIVEAIITRRDVHIAPVDEKHFGIDLDKDGRLDVTDTVVFDWAPRQGRMMSYVGQAQQELEKGRLHLAGGLFPEGTEFLQSVRYIGIGPQDEIGLANRMKELRYMRKRTWQTYATLEERALAERKERDDFPDRTRQIIGNAEQGVNNGNGWVLQGFIEDRTGRLRPQSFEETVSCVGCHGGLGVTTDSVFSFPRKLDAAHIQRGWYHWGQKTWAGLPEPKIEIRGAGVFYEYSYYVMYNHSANEYRYNPEVLAQFYNADGTARQDMLDRLHDDIAVLLNPSRERALELNKAYRTIVEDQDFLQGRDAFPIPLKKTVYEDVEQDQLTGVQQPTNTQRFAGRFGPACLAVSPPAASVQASLAGKGMAGPSGIPYETDWSGVIHKSRYSIDIPGVHFTFPRRLTLPTRVIVPVGKTPACLTCHRIDYPSIPGTREIIDSPDMPLTSAHTPNTNSRRRLTSDTGQDQNGIWHPDGSTIAFVSDRSGSSQIWLMDADGSHQRQLSREPAIHAWPQWHPGGKRVVVWGYDPATGNHQIKTIAVADGAEQLLVSSTEMLDRPTFHPGGALMAYAAQDNGNWDIWLMDVIDKNPMRLTTDPQMESNPLWSGDGRALSYKVAPATGIYSLTGQYFMTFENGFDNPTIHAWNGPQSVQMNHWSPDGTKIVYTAEVINDASGRDQVTYAAMVSDLKLDNAIATASGSRLLANGCTLGDRGPVFSPNGKSVAFWAWNKDNTASIWRYDVASDTATPLTADGIDMYPQWSPDGKTLLLESNYGGQIDLVTLAVHAK
jgi:Tol biopolymer transport system component